MPARSSRELIVLAGNGQTVARQARFDVRSIAAVTWVTCIEGGVEVTAGDRSYRFGPGNRSSIRQERPSAGHRLRPSRGNLLARRLYRLPRNARLPMPWPKSIATGLAGGDGAF